MLFTPGHALPYPEGADFAEGSVQLERLARRLDELLAAYDAAHAAMLARPFGMLRRSTTETGFSQTITGTVDNGEYVSWDDTVALHGGVQDLGAGLGTPAAGVYPSLWMVQSSIRVQASGGVTANSARLVQIEVEWTDPTTEQFQQERLMTTTDRTVGAVIEGWSLSMLYRCIAPTDFFAKFGHANAASTMNVLADSHMSIAYIGECE